LAILKIGRGVFITGSADGLVRVKQIVIEMAGDAQGCISGLEAQLAEVEARKSEISAKLTTARLASERFYNF
jgi:hypothetical protein